MSSTRTEILTDRTQAAHWKRLYNARLISIHRYQKNIERLLLKYRTQRQIREN